MRQWWTGGPISAQVTIADVTGDGQDEIVAASDGLYVWRQNGRLLPGFPVYGGNAFASRPLVLPLRDKSKAIFIGCDDNALYGFDSAGHLFPNYPLLTGGDVYSSPTAADLDGDGLVELVVGSDDGQVYAWRLDGTPLPGWPQKTGGFVAASPVLADIDGDGLIEVVAGSWDGHVYIWKGDGSLLEGWPQATRHFVWSTPLVADFNGDGQMEIIAASDRVYVWDCKGHAPPGWPVDIPSYVVGRPLVLDLTGDGELDLVVGADGLYAWSQDGRSIDGYPVSFDSFCWSSPIAIPDDRHDAPKIAICGWDGHLRIIQNAEITRTIQISNHPIFATPTMLAPFNAVVKPEIVVGAWDGCIYFVLPDATPSEIANTTLPVYLASDLQHISEGEVPFIRFNGPVRSKAILYYQADHEDRVHPVPLVVHRGALTGLIQPFRAGTRVSFWAEIGDRRDPSTGSYQYQVRLAWLPRIRHRIKKLLYRR